MLLGVCFRASVLVAEEPVVALSTESRAIPAVAAKILNLTFVRRMRILHSA